ncbi:O-antigen ligase family protein [Streptomyces sp. H10-C2]|uniref:O-antigen ligase family protein n=1 Tax=unclassified Streptomyces TaxID=2593676 RepID=UPI0024B8FAAB|nr:MULTISPECIES: O-antigen ligase family protein [unclassified Streptomyces]MDJ0340345.1 O-antigen ligase family protein [Streptomyces sp. PH10-H1]MDJ0368207.1 O-antigen ligase family protein [Streptomyces sp. H10-C2]
MAAGIPGTLSHPGRRPRAVSLAIGHVLRQWARRQCVWRQWAWLGPLLPALATVLLLAAPIETGDVTASGKITPADAASAVLVAFCAVRALRDRARPLTRAAAVILGAPVVAVAIATITSGDPAASLDGFVRYLQVFVLVPTALVLLLRDRRDFLVVAGSVVLLALVQGAIGVYQYATGTGASYVGENIRAVGTFGPSDVMGMATVVAYGLMIAVGLALAPATAGAPRWLRPAALGCAAALVVPLVVSFSRGTWIATVLACTVMTVLAGWRRAVRIFAVTAAAGVVLVGGAGVGSQLITDRVASITRVTDAPDASVTDRYSLWAAATGMWREQPFTGVGLKGFPAHRDGHAALNLSSGSDTAGAGQQFKLEPLLSPHNMYLLILSEQGLVGVTLIVGSWAALLVGGVRRLTAAHRTGHGTDRGLIATALLLWQCVDFLYSDIGGPSTVLTALLFGLAAAWALQPAADDEGTSVTSVTSGDAGDPVAAR